MPGGIGSKGRVLISMTSNLADVWGSFVVVPGTIWKFIVPFLGVSAQSTTSPGRPPNCPHAAVAAPSAKNAMKK